MDNLLQRYHLMLKRWFHQW